MTFKARAAFLLVLLCMALLVAACGDDDEDSGGAATADSGSQTESESSGELDNAWALEYTGGTAGAADESKQPVKIGWVNQEEGVPAFPETTVAIDTAVRYINEQLGGIDGRPLEVVKCFVASEEDGQKCGSQFVNDDEIQAVLVGVIVVGNDSLYKTIGTKKPILISSAASPADFSAPGAHVLNAGAAGPIAGMGLFIAQNLKGTKTVAVVHSDNQAGKEVATGLLAPTLEAANIEVRLVPVADDATGPDVVSAIQASDAANADVFVPIVQEPQCIVIPDALKTLGIEPQVVSVLTCWNPAVLEALGGDPPEGWYFTGFADNPFIPSVETGTDTYVAAMNALGGEKFTYSGQAVLSFSLAMTLAKLGNELGADGITPKALEGAIMGFRGPAMMVPGPMDCGFNEAMPTICGREATVDQFKGGKWISVRGGTSGKPLDVFPE